MYVCMDVSMRQRVRETSKGREMGKKKDCIKVKPVVSTVAGVCMLANVNAYRTNNIKTKAKRTFHDENITLFRSCFFVQIGFSLFRCTNDSFFSPLLSWAIK